MPPKKPPRKSKKPKRGNVYLNTSRGSRMLEEFVTAKCGTYDTAAKMLSDVAGSKIERASVWHWARGVHRPSRAGSMVLEKCAGIPFSAWDQSVTKG